MGARALIWLAAALPLAAAAEVEGDDANARLRATREWRGADTGGRARLFEAARRERDRYAIGTARAAEGVSSFGRVAGSSFVSVGPTRADFAVNGDRYEEIDSGRVRQILPHPLDPDILYVSTSGGGVWKTYGARPGPSEIVQWEPLTDALGTTAIGTLAMDPANPDLLFLGFGDPFDVQQPGITRSTDGGGTWSVLSDWLPNNSQNRNIRRPYVHADLHAFAVGADGTFYAGSDGGLFVSGNALAGLAADVTFTSARNEGLVTHLAYSVACAPESWEAGAQGFVAGGLQDNGTRLRAGDSTTFNQILGGDGIGLAVSASTDAQGVPRAFLASVPGGIYLSRDGGQTFNRFPTGLAPLPFFVRIARETAAGDSYLTFSGAPAGFYRWQDGEAAWSNVSGTLHWQDSNRDTAGFTPVDGPPIGLRNLAAHPRRAGVWGAVSNRFSYMTADGGAHWLVGVQPRPSGSSGGAYLLSSLEFDPEDASGATYYLTALSTSLVDAQNNFSDYPPGFGHLFRTRNGGLTWESLGGQDPASGGLPDVGADVIKVDPNDAGTLYAGTEVGLYRSTDSGATWARFGAGSLPLVAVTDLCIAPGTQRLTAATYGRGFWQIDTVAGAAPAGVRGIGDTNFDGRIDGEDLTDLADGFGATQSSATYRWQADLVGTSNGIDQADLDALLAKFGGRP